MLPSIHCPTDGDILKAEEEVDIQYVWSRLHRVEDGASIAPVAFHDLGIIVRYLGLGDLHQRNRFIHNRRMLEVAKNTA